MIFSFNELKRYSLTAGYMYRSRCAREHETWWVGRRINDGSAALKGGATVYLYGMKAFALAIVISVLQCVSNFHDGCIRG
jgi:hypothetical protein